MFSQSLMQSLMYAVVPERFPATVTLNPGHATLEEEVEISSAWSKDYSSAYATYNQVNVEGASMIIKIPNIELNPANNGREIREGDLILFRGETFKVTGGGGLLKSLRTRWECACRRVPPT